MSRDINIDYNVLVGQTEIHWINGKTLQKAAILTYPFRDQLRFGKARGKLYLV